MEHIQHADPHLRIQISRTEVLGANRVEKVEKSRNRVETGRKRSKQAKTSCTPGFRLSPPCFDFFPPVSTLSPPNQPVNLLMLACNCVFLRMLGFMLQPFCQKSG